MLEAAAAVFVIIAIVASVTGVMIFYCSDKPACAKMHVMTLNRSADTMSSLEPEIQAALASKRAELVDLHVCPVQQGDHIRLLITILYRR